MIPSSEPRLVSASLRPRDQALPNTASNTTHPQATSVHHDGNFSSRPTLRRQVTGPTATDTRSHRRNYSCSLEKKGQVKSAGVPYLPSKLVGEPQAFQSTNLGYIVSITRNVSVTARRVIGRPARQSAELSRSSPAQTQTSGIVNSLEPPAYYDVITDYCEAAAAPDTHSSEAAWCEHSPPNVLLRSPPKRGVSLRMHLRPPSDATLAPKVFGVRHEEPDLMDGSLASSAVIKDPSQYLEMSPERGCQHAFRPSNRQCSLRSSLPRSISSRNDSCISFSSSINPQSRVSVTRLFEDAFDAAFIAVGEAPDKNENTSMCSESKHGMVDMLERLIGTSSLGTSATLAKLRSRVLSSPSADHLLCTVLLQGQNLRLPRIVVNAVTDIYQRGLNTRGLLRITGDPERIENLFQLYQSPPHYGDQHNLAREDIHVVCGLLKCSLRLRPEPLLNEDLFETLWINCVDPSLYLPISASPSLPDHCLQKRVSIAQCVLRLASSQDLSLLIYLLLFMDHATLFSENRLTPRALATIFGPALLCPRKINREEPVPTPSSRMMFAPDEPSVARTQAIETLAWMLKHWRMIVTGLGSRFQLSTPDAPVLPQTDAQALSSPSPENTLSSISTTPLDRRAGRIFFANRSSPPPELFIERNLSSPAGADVHSCGSTPSIRTPGAEEYFNMIKSVDEASPNSTFPLSPELPVPKPRHFVRRRSRSEPPVSPPPVIVFGGADWTVEKDRPDSTEIATIQPLVRSKSSRVGSKRTVVGEVGLSVPTGGSAIDFSHYSLKPKLMTIREILAARAQASVPHS